MSITTYNYARDKDKFLSEHFQVKEFVAQSDYYGDYPSDFPIHDKLTEILEKVYTHFGCTLGIICSGYRTPALDLEVGGSGSGPHTLGIAVDVYYYRNGEPIPSRLVACYLQDIGIKGIGLNCGGNPNGTHFDMRGYGVWEGSVWFGDETDYSCGYNDYYSYTGTSKSEVYPNGMDKPAVIENQEPAKDETQSTNTSATVPSINLKGKKGVDISSCNGKVDFAKIKAAGYDFVMIRCGFGENIAEQDDTYWEENVRKAEAAGMPWGAYFYSYACSEASARSELEHVLRLLKGKRPTLPVALDMEDADGYHARHGGWNFSTIDKVCRIFLKGIAEAGYYPLLYTGFEEIENLISEEVWKGNDMWFAHWASKCGYAYDNLAMWQYGGETNILESNSISGVGVIDKDMCYRDYVSIITKGGYNGFDKSKGTVPPAPATNGVTAAQAMSAARNLVEKDENPEECDIMAWYGTFSTRINNIACCCAGMMYLFGKVLNALNLIPGGKVADCGSLALNFYNAGQLHKANEVKPGDLVIFSWSGDDTSVKPLDSLGYKCFEHVELCLKVCDGTILSVGANNGGYECDDFQIKTRDRSDISACCRPKYADGESEDIPATVTEAAIGDKYVNDVQTWLNAYYGFDIYIDGVYGSQTKAALVMALQTELNIEFDSGLDVDGIYGPMTNSEIRNVFNGVSGNYVKVLQGFLMCNGYDTGGLDGIFGNATEKAVEDYQSENGLVVDGIAGPATFGSLAS